LNQPNRTCHVHSKAQHDRRRIPNEQIAQTDRENSEMILTVASIDPHKRQNPWMRFFFVWEFLKSDILC